MEKEALSSNTFNRRVLPLRLLKGTAAVVLTLFICLFMVVQIKTNTIFIALLNAIMLLCVIVGISSNIKNFKSTDKIILAATIIYFAVRLLSYRINKVPVTYGGSMMIQAFFLIGICRILFGDKTQKKIVLITFVIFDVIAMLSCYYIYFYRYDYAHSLVMDYYWDKGMTEKASLFQNVNTAGLIAAATVIICMAMLVEKKPGVKKILLLGPIALLNLYMLFHDTGCRSAQTGLIVVALLSMVITLIKKADSVRALLCVVLIGCFILLAPLYTLVYWGDNEYYLDDYSHIEQIVDNAASGRYAVWKIAILAQKGHVLFGFGGHNNAVEKRQQFVNNFDHSKVSDLYREQSEHGSAHNGYLSMLVEAGIVGTVLLLIILLRRIWMLKGRFRDGNWHYMLIVYIFWVNLFEAKLINAIFFTGFLMMVLLMPNEEDNENECKVIPEATKEEIKEAI